MNEQSTGEGIGTHEVPVRRLADARLRQPGVPQPARAGDPPRSSPRPAADPVAGTPLRALLRIAGPRRRRLWRAAGLSAVAQLADMAAYLLLGWSFLVVVEGISAALLPLGLGTVPGQLLFLTAASALGIAVTAVLSHLATTSWRDLAQSVQHDWRVETYGHVQRAGLRHLEGGRATGLSRVLTTDIDQLGRFFATSANDLVQLGTSILVLLPGFLFFAPEVAWLVFLPVPLIAWLSLRHQERTSSGYAAGGERGALLNSRLTSNLEASTTVKSFGAEQHEIERIRDLSEQYRRTNRSVDAHAAAYTQGVRAAVMISMAVITLAGGVNVLAGTIPFAVFNVLAGLPYTLLGRLPVIGGAVDEYQRAVAALRRVVELRGLPVEQDGSGRRLASEEVAGDVRFDRVTFSYPGRDPVLRDLSLRFPAGKTTGIVGVTGAGKTTIAKLLLRLEEADSGRVLLDGRDTRDIRLEDLRGAISFVGQDAYLFDGTALDNIRYGSFGAAPETAVRAARSAAAHEFIQDMPAQYETVLGERGAVLSGGQRQRISLARAFVKDAPIVLLDEATSAVDNETESAVQRALADFSRDRTLIIIAHRLSTIRHADRIYVMGGGGAVAETGTHDELLARRGVYAALWNLQIGEAGP